MSGENVELVRAICSAWGEGDIFPGAQTYPVP
jgi:hypothetical protein